jgi:hypothetical protein
MSKLFFGWKNRVGPSFRIRNNFWANFLIPDVFKKLLYGGALVFLSRKKSLKSCRLKKARKKNVDNFFWSDKATQHMSNVVYTFCVKRKKVRLG